MTSCSRLDFPNLTPKKYNMVLAKFESHFIMRRNIIFEWDKRIRSTHANKKKGESVNTLITALYVLAEHGDLYDEMIRDQIVVSILHCWKNHSLIQTSHLSCNAGAPIRSHQTAAALTVGVEVCMGKPDQSHPTERGPGQRTNRR